MRNFKIAIGACAAIVTAVPLSAETGDGRRVEIRDLDLATVEGQARLDRRVVRAAREICRAEVPETGSHLISQDAKDCVADAVAKTRSHVAARLARQPRPQGT